VGAVRGEFIMISKAKTPFRVVGLCFVFGVAFAATLRAQAPPGPIVPARTATDADASAPPRLNPRAQPPREKPVPRPTIAGAWKLNRDQSDDARRKIEEAARDASSRNGRWGGSSPGAGGGGNGPYGGGPLGGGYPFPGQSGGPYGGNHGAGRNQESEGQTRGLREYMYPASSVNIAINNAETDFTDETGRKLVFYTDGRKLQKSKDENYREIAAHWEGSQLVAKEKSPEEGEIRRTFELSGDGRQLDEYVTLEVGRSHRSVMLHYAYDIPAN
jgi:hypothetical protein